MSPHVLVINSGSSSLKYSLVDVDAAQSVASGSVERIGEDGASLHHHGPDGAVEREDAVPDHETALREVLDVFTTVGPSLAGTDLVAVGHRVVHGGDRFAEPVVVDDEVEAAIASLVPLAPLHQPANLEGIRVGRATFPWLPQVAVFDTAFHQTLPPYASTYAVPRSWEREHGVRRYGFHGTSHAYVSRTAAQLLGRPLEDLALVVLHLGNGASAAAVDAGRSVDTSMGLTPLEGLVMGSRSGDLDVSVVAHLHRAAGLDVEAIDRALNHDSGLTGLAGANDLREVHRRADDGDEDARLALEVYCYRIRKYVGAYYAAMGRLDAVVFTAGVGEHDARVRAASLAGLERLGIAVDPARNDAPSGDARVVSPDDSGVTVLVVPTDEELEIAQQVLALVRASR